MSDFLNVSWAVARRSLTVAFKNPALVIPAILFPLVFLIAFAGGLSKIGDVPGFDFPSGYTAFQFVFVFIQSAAFGGVFTGFGIAADFENGFARRLLVGAPRRSGLIVGYVIAAIGRWLATGVVITVAALIAGMEVGGNAVDLFGLLALGLLVNITAALFGAGISMRAQTIQIAPVMQLPIFIGLFLAPVYVPLKLLDGWIKALAKLNPATALIESGRGFISGDPEKVALAFACGAGLVALLSVYALLGLRKAERGT